jgi:hypothetical protein
MDDTWLLDKRRIVRYGEASQFAGKDPVKAFIERSRTSMEGQFPRDGGSGPESEFPFAVNEIRRDWVHNPDGSSPVCSSKTDRENS